MMKIKFTGKYKSLTDFESEELPNFVVITGKNGSGKSQLIEAISSGNGGSEHRQYYFETQITPQPLKGIHTSNLIYHGSGIASEGSLRPALDLYISAFRQLKSAKKKLCSILYENELPFEKLDFADIYGVEKFLGETKEDAAKFVQNIFREEQGYHRIEEHLLKIFTGRIKGLFSPQDIRLLQILSIIKRSTEKKFDLIEANDFLTVPIPYHFVDSSGLFTSKVEDVFLLYLKRRRDNELNFFRNVQYYESNLAVSDKEYAMQHQAPWDTINSILASVNLGLAISTFTMQDYYEGMTLTVKFRKEGIVGLIDFNELSTGEKMIIGIVLKLFTIDYYKKELVFPDMIILDEPDAFLHPEMSRLLINVLKKTFVDDLGIRVVITTHSPATVALAPEESIFEMNNSPKCSLSKISKDAALTILTGNIPTLSIDYRNHRQVFVESPTDLQYYQWLFDKLYNSENLSHKLYFISSQKGKSNCDSVIKVVQDLRAGGAGKIYGIIDWDGKRSSTDNILVHGENIRYSIETFIYDAIYISIFLLQNNGDNIRNELSISHTYNEFDLPKEKPERIQEIWNWYIGRIVKANPELKVEKLVDIKYANNLSVSIPEWYVTKNGHKDLEPKIRKAFKALEKHANGTELQEVLTLIIAKCYPIVPSESVELLKKLAS